MYHFLLNLVVEDTADATVVVAAAASHHTVERAVGGDAVVVAILQIYILSCVTVGSVSLFFGKLKP